MSVSQREVVEMQRNITAHLVDLTEETKEEETGATGSFKPILRWPGDLLLSPTSFLLYFLI